METQQRLAVSIPSMLMTYLTGSGTSTTAEDGAIPSTTITKIKSTSSDSDTDNANTKPDGAAVQRNSTSDVKHLAPPFHRKSHLVMFDDSDLMSRASGDLSREGSFNSTNPRARKRLSKPRTSYSILQPPPKPSARQKIHVKSRPLLQLHLLNASARPKPAFELLHSAIFSPSLSRAISKAFPKKHGPSPNDLAIVRAETYHQHEASNHSDEDETRDVLAVISKSRKGDGSGSGKAKIYLDDGSEWDAFASSNGGYEFVSTDTHGLTTTVRWVLKRPRARRSQSATDVESPRIDTTTKKFNFSTISPNSRRHPIIANLTSTTLDINDSYTMPSPVGSASPPGESESRISGDFMQTTPALRTLITATAVWIAVREGWSPGYRYDDSMVRSPSTRLSVSPSKLAGESNDAFKEGEPRRSTSIAHMFRTSTAMKRLSNASAPANSSAEDIAMSRNSSLRSVSGSRRRRPRAESTSTVIHRATLPRPDFRNMRTHTMTTAASNNSHGQDYDKEMTEEGESESGSGSASEDSVATPSKEILASGSVLPVMASIEPQDEPIVEQPREVERHRKEVFADNKILKQEKRYSSATDTTTESRKAEEKPSHRRKRRKALRVLLCGMA
ncbi:hypothetical protein AAFC00_004775 [Neodothiora populina]|uniref:Uncharacterized protein n=1 Tax=Neodothiora populina TaxID=2781224 RepID=A0ABR3P3A0_9PEZI